VSVDRPSSALSPGVEHGGPLYPWETLFSALEPPLGRSELAGVLVEEGVRPTRAAAVDMVDAAIQRGGLAFDGTRVRPASRQSNLNKSVNSATAEFSASESAGEKERPSIEEKVAEFASEYPIRVTQPLADLDGVSLRRDYAEVETVSWEAEPVYRCGKCDGESVMAPAKAPSHIMEFHEEELEEADISLDVAVESFGEAEKAPKGEEVTDVSAVEWGEAVRTLLEKYGRTKSTTINLEKGSWRTPAEHDTFSIQAENRWFASYQKKYYAQLDAWLRELCGGERPSGGYTEPSFENPKVALLTRSASSVPGGERVGPVTHAEELRDSWQPVYHTLRNTLRSEGYELGEDWQYDRRLEPHTGKRGNDSGTNECYAHEHIIVVIDGDVTSGDLRPVIEKHVEACEWAGQEAHGEEAIEVREPDELNDVAGYVADYCSIDPVELWEREPAYVAWAAAMDAGNVRTVSRSETAREAAVADACKQRAESEEADQVEGHAESVVRLKGERVCLHCESSHEISQEGTLTAHRGSESEVATDGGIEVPDREEELRERWPSADAAVAVGESPQRRKQREVIRGWLQTDMSLGEFWACEEPGVPPPEDAEQLVAEVEHPGYEPEAAVGFDNTVPTWRVKSVTIDGEERPASAGNGIEMVEVTNVRGRLVSELGIETGQRYRCECGVAAYGETMVSHLGSHGIEEPELASGLIAEESV